MYGRLENRMVVESEWPKHPLECCLEAVPGFVRRLKWTEDFKKMIMEWFYSDGNWIWED